ncbi:hypothetical protein H5410_023135 [Solanum commersonii]|uniref:Endonuclease/exonuclease/phosphatase domain-containing protein n=1 Tax=Solanum commersonii TaxID=4109 RepID=A0A9J5ZJY4_SOLCO|nr:hypothetical protein H5410_023135 [Solanum commersonii]
MTEDVEDSEVERGRKETTKYLDTHGSSDEIVENSVMESSLNTEIKNPEGDKPCEEEDTRDSSKDRVDDQIANSKRTQLSEDEQWDPDDPGRSKIEGYKKFLGFHHCISNDIEQIWCFWNQNLHATVISNEDQQITLDMGDDFGVNGVHITSVYAKCSDIERVDLWDSLANMNSQVQDALCIGGDFNVMLEASEKNRRKTVSG